MTDTSAKNTTLLQTAKISKQFGGNKVFNEISISLDKGKVLGVIGPNGAGKTTLINVISGQLQPTNGQILLGGRDVTPVSFHARSSMGLVRTFQQTKAFKTATVLENLQRAQLFSKKGMALDAPYVTALLDFAGLASRMDQVADTLPYGMQKMLGLMMAFVTEPQILLLDEPAAGLEKDERFFIDRYVEAAMRELGCGVLLVEHDMELVKRLCPRICVLDGGKLIAEGTPAEVLSRRDVIEAYLGSAADEEVSHA